MKKLREQIDHLQDRFESEKKMNMAELIDTLDMVVSEMEKLKEELDKKEDKKAVKTR